MQYHSSLKLLAPVNVELAKYDGRNVFFEPLDGNNGDTLIQMGSSALLKKAGISLVSHPKLADLIIINGGGAMNDIHEIGLKAIRKYNRYYPDTPLVILPSSFYFEKTDFSTLFKDRNAAAYIYSRELYSLDFLEKLMFPCPVRLGIDHDMAFYLDMSYISRLLNKKATKHILIVEREDQESVTIDNKQPVKSNLWHYLPWQLRAPINRRILWPIKYKFIHRQFQKTPPQSPFASQQLQRVVEDHPELEGLPIYNADISCPQFYGFDEFGSLIAEAAAVVTTRLHVAILASMLNKPVYLKPGSYYKIRGIYEYSLADKANVHLI